MQVIDSAAKQKIVAEPTGATNIFMFHCEANMTCRDALIQRLLGGNRAVLHIIPHFYLGIRVIYCVLFLYFFAIIRLPFGLLATHSSDDEFICQVFPA